MTALLHALFPTWGDVVAAGAWLLLIVVYLVLRFRDEILELDRTLDDVLETWGRR